MAGENLNYTPNGWPFLDEDNYLDVIDDYTLDLANKLELVGFTPPGHVADTGWQTLTLATGFTAGSEGVRYRVRNGLVHLSGLVQRTAGSYQSSYVTVGTLPVAARPTRNIGPVNSATRIGDGQSLIVIQSDGAIRVAGTSNDRVALEAVPPYPR